MLSPEFVLVPAGEFPMGSDHPDFFESYPPMQTQISRSYWIQTSEVTWAEALHVEEQVMARGLNAHPHMPPADQVPALHSLGVDLGREPDFAPAALSFAHALLYANGRSLLEGLEVCYDFSPCYADAVATDDGRTSAFRLSQCTWLVTRLATPACTGYRLPTEAEWEWAARAGRVDQRYGCGPSPACLREQAFILSPDCSDGAGCLVAPEYAIPTECAAGQPVSEATGAVPVGSCCANAWGLYDTQGNLREWTMDLRSWRRYLDVSELGRTWEGWTYSLDRLIDPHPVEPEVRWDPSHPDYLVPVSPDVGEGSASIITKGMSWRGDLPNAVVWNFGYATATDQRAVRLVRLAQPDGP
jgi:sulfatase modifying factor 1